ncbi:hypothetical protein ACHAWF_003217 [Thalassiosira exigua]
MRPALVWIPAAIVHTSIRSSCVGAFTSVAMKRSRDDGGVRSPGQRRRGTASAAGDSAAAPPSSSSAQQPQPPLYLAEGLLAVHKPLTWTSSDVVSYVRGILIRDAKDRGAAEDGGGGGGGGKRGGGRKRRGPLMKVGHGGTLDPLASGVLVLGVGKGTTLLQAYLNGDKQYTAACELGYETDTLDAEGKLVKTAPWDHVKSVVDVTKVVPKFTGKIEQIPPLYSAIRVDGKRLYEIARKDSEKAAEGVEIPKREVTIHELSVGTLFEEDIIQSGVVDGPRYREAAQALEAAAAETAKDDTGKNAESGEGSDGEEDVGGGKRKRKRNKKNKNKGTKKKNLFNEETVPALEPNCGDLELPRFALSLRCGGGTYVRSLVRDVGYELDTVATMTGLVRTKQGPFVLGDALQREDWNADAIYEAIRRSKERGIC